MPLGVFTTRRRENIGRRASNNITDKSNYCGSRDTTAAKQIVRDCRGTEKIDHGIVTLVSLRLAGYVLTLLYRRTGLPVVYCTFEETRRCANVIFDEKRRVHGIRGIASELLIRVLVPRVRDGFSKFL